MLESGPPHVPALHDYPIMPPWHPRARSDQHLLEKCLHFHRPPGGSSNKMFQEERKSLGAAGGRRSCGGAQLPRCSRPLRSGTRLSSVGQRCVMRLRSRNVKGRQRGTTTRKADRAAGTGSEVSGTRTRASRFSSPRQVRFASLRMETFFPALLGTRFPGI